MSFLKFTRHAEWWEYKLPPLLSVAYATLLYCGYPLKEAILQILLLLLAIIAGAIYVSVVNDITDIKEDFAAGKRNSMLKLPTVYRIVIVTTLVLLGFFFSYLLYPDWRSIIFYGLAYLVFSAYSIRPIRLKERGLLGLACDSMGAHLFPSLLITSNLLYVGGAKVSLAWFIAISSWSFLYGIRGILWHQFQDRNNDLISGTRTFATDIDPKRFQAAEFTILALELIAFTTFISYFIEGPIVLAIFLYSSLVVLRILVLKRKARIIVTFKSEQYQLLLNDFYIVFFPLVLLINIGLGQHFAWIILSCHLLLFPMNTIAVVRDFIISFKKIFQKL